MSATVAGWIYSSEVSTRLLHIKLLVIHEYSNKPARQKEKAGNIYSSKFGEYVGNYLPPTQIPFFGGS